MKLLFDLFPVILFFIATTWRRTCRYRRRPRRQRRYQAAADQLPILLATAMAIAATFIQIGWLKLRGHRVEPMLWISLVIILVFGGATLLLQRDFHQWKPTVLYWLFAAVLVVSAIVFRRILSGP
jgi:intracellular septation protein